jgi:hypothetical protein
MNKAKEIKHLLTFKDGWMGGEWLADGYPINVYDVAWVIVSRKRYPPFTKIVKGYDSDHGHSYSWTRADLRIKGGPFNTLVSVKDLMDRRYKIYVVLDWL